MSTSGTFTQFLFDRAIISKQQADVLNSSLRDGDEARCINAMTDFFSSMSPSDSYDLAFRLFMAWVKAAKSSSIPPSRQDTTEESIHLTPIHSKAASRKVNNNQSNSARNKRSTSPTFNEVRSRMNTNSSNNLNYYSAQSNESVFNKLYNDAHKKNFMLQQYQDHKYATETDECTFQPNSRRSPQRTNGEVFERLQQDIRGFKQQINENKRQEIEMRHCTFSPTINSSSLIDGEISYTSISQTFDRLYNDKKLKELHSYENEVRKQEKEMAGCTFKPVLSPGTLKSYSQLDDSESERFHRLYKNHEEKLKKNEQKVREKSLEESNKYSFKPQRVASPTPGGRFKEANKEDKKVVDRLMGWYNDRKKKHDNRVEEQGRKITEDANTSLSTKRRKRDLDETTDSIPAYDRLYKQYSSKKSKNEALEKKVMKEIGASFTPKTNRTRSLSTSSRSKETYHSRAVNNTRPASPVRDFNVYGRKNNSIQYGSVNELIRAK